jgi:uncharacterized membrane protein YkoI
LGQDVLINRDAAALEQFLKNQNMTQPLSTRPMINGSINMNSLVSDAVASHLKVNLSQAVTIAEQYVGNDTHAVNARLQIQDGYLVYSVSVVEPNSDAVDVIVDPGTGKPLAKNDIAMTPLVTTPQPMTGGDFIQRPIG